MRKSKVAVVTMPGRDENKHFLITEMSASKAERWAIRAFLALARSNTEVPDDVENLGMAAIAAIGFRALMAVSFDEASDLMSEMMACVKYMPSPERPEIVREIFEEDIEEVATHLYLKAEVFDLHTGFSTAASLSSSVAALVTTGVSTPRSSTSPRRSRR